MASPSEGPHAHTMLTFVWQENLMVAPNISMRACMGRVHPLRVKRRNSLVWLEEM